MTWGSGVPTGGGGESRSPGRPVRDLEGDMFPSLQRASPGVSYRGSAPPLPRFLTAPPTLFPAPSPGRDGLGNQRPPCSGHSPPPGAPPASVPRVPPDGTGWW